MSLDRTRLDTALAVAVDLEQYLSENNIDDLWTEAVRASRAATGATYSRSFGTYDSEFREPRVSYTLDLSDSTVSFAGTDPEGDWHYYTLPTDFIFPETRQRAVDALRAKHTEQAAKQQANAKADAEKKRAADEAEFARLARTLGKTI